MKFCRFEQRLSAHHAFVMITHQGVSGAEEDNPYRPRDVSIWSSVCGLPARKILHHFNLELEHHTVSHYLKFRNDI